jgi:hypothetical protein
LREHSAGDLREGFGDVIELVNVQAAVDSPDLVQLGKGTAAYELR